MNDLSGKSILVTGATDGIGKVTARELARMGARVTIVGRNPTKTQAAAAELSAQSPHPVQTLVGDLSIQAEVRRVAAEYRAANPRLDVLVNNAGALFTSRQVSADGIEMTLALNHLNYFLLTHLLLDMLKASAPARIVNVSSAAHVGGRINLQDIQLTRGYSSWGAYSQSKLANVLFTYELARRLEGSGVTVNALHPGFVATRFGRSNGGLFDPLFRLFQVAAITPEQGAETSIYLASSPEVEGVSGRYFDKKKAVSSSALSYRKDTAEQLWALSEAMTASVGGQQLPAEDGDGLTADEHALPLAHQA